MKFVATVCERLIIYSQEKPKHAESPYNTQSLCAHTAESQLVCLKRVSPKRRQAKFDMQTRREFTANKMKKN